MQVHPRAPTLGDLRRSLSEAHKHFLIDSLIPTDSLVLITGDAGCGKTLVKTHLCLSLLSNQPAFGLFSPTRPDGCKILYVNGEMTSTDFVSYFSSVADSLGLEQTELEEQIVCPTLDAPLREESGWVSLEAFVRTDKPTLVILDTFRATTDVDENSAQDVRRLLNRLRRLSAEFHCAIIISHHLRKMGHFNNDSRSRVSGTTDLVAGVDTHIALESKPGHLLHRMTLTKTRRAANLTPNGTSWDIASQKMLDSHGGTTLHLVASARSGKNDSRTQSQVLPTELVTWLKREGSVTTKQLDGQGIKRKKLENYVRAGLLLKNDSGRGRPSSFTLPTSS